MTWFIAFAVLVFATYFWLQYRDRQRDRDRPTSEQRLGVRFIGQSLTLENPIRDGSGKVRLGNRDWVVRGPNLPSGARVRVTGVDGTILLVDRVAA